MKVSTKLVGGFLSVAAICVVIGFVGFRGLSTTSDSLDKIGNARLPGIQHLATISQSETDVETALAILLQEGCTFEMRRENYDRTRKAFRKADEARKALARLPRSTKEDALWKQVVSAWNKWKTDVDDFIFLSNKLNDYGIENPMAFKAMLGDLLVSHTNWALHLSESIMTHSDFDGGLDPAKCEFGKYLASFTSENEDLKRIFKKISLPHMAAHTAAQSVMDTLKQKDNFSSEMMNEMLSNIFTGEVTPSLKQIEKYLDEAEHISGEALALRDQMEAQYREVILPSQRKLNGLLNELVQMNNTSAEADVRKSIARARHATTTSLIGIAIGVLLAMGLGVLTSRSITKPLKKVIAVAEKAENGDLTVTREEFGVTTRDELGEMADALAKMIEGQRKTVDRIAAAAAAIAKGTESLAALSEESSSSMEEVRGSVEKVGSLSESNSAALEESNAGIEQISSSAQTVAHSSVEGSEAAERTKERANNAVENVNDVIDEMKQVAKKTKTAEGSIQHLTASVENISNFVGIITSIADQTNLLALNAAIEAARAGDAGRGFAVVADEVRKLAEESAKAAKEVATLIETLQEDARTSGKITTDTEAVMTRTVDQAAEAQGKLNELQEEIAHIADSIQHMAGVSQEQASSSQEMAAAIEQVSTQTVDIVSKMDVIRRSTEETTTVSENVATESQTMAERTEELLNFISRFKIEAEGLEAVETPGTEPRALPKPASAKA